MNRTHLPYTLEQLVILRAVAKGGSFKNAAQSLFLTQPAVSLQIQNLEKQLKTNLFDRTKKQIELTEAGTLLLRYSNRILALCEESSRVLDDLSELQSGKLVIGASQTTGTYLMPKIIGLFQQKYPNINVQLNVDSTRKVAWHLMNRQVDIGIVGGKIPKELRKILEITPYVEDELALIVPPSHPYVKLECIKKEDLYDLKFISLNSYSTIRTVVDDTLSKNGIDVTRLKVEMELNSIEAIKNAVQSSLGAAFVSVSAITKELELNLLNCVRIEDVKINRKLCIILNPNRYKSKASENFTKEILTLLK
jgi:DNA-binding transcriptional LysR family regulator|uniref:Probable RuBisCO transcriptional regulator n=1 Tax=uncultured Pelagomonas TaxID=660917 RepID=J9QUX5_9STRA|nr:LysR-like transcriptional regulator [uncultured Pelagomonas]|tara:strand:+ start:696 stop:1619 length:924 start_codon:yes stop_codon:yes gene_type:complete